MKSVNSIHLSRGASGFGEVSHLSAGDVLADSEVLS